MPSNPLLLERATQYWQTVNAAFPKLPVGIQTVLRVRLGSGDVSWALSLVLAGWRLSKIGDSEAVALLRSTSTGLTELIKQLEVAALTMPASFQQSLTAAEAASDGFAGAATYLADALNDLITLQQNALVTWLNGAQFRDEAGALVRRFPPPDSGLASAWDGGGSMNPATTPSRVVSRADRADRQDRPPGRSGAPPKRANPAVKAAAAAPPEPSIGAHQAAHADLLGRGWTSYDAGRILSGASGNAGSALAIRRLLRTYGSLREAERGNFRAAVSHKEQTFGLTMAALADVNVLDIQRVREAEVLEARTGVGLFEQYSELNPPERKRVVRWILDAEPTAFSGQQP